MSSTPKPNKKKAVAKVKGGKSLDLLRKDIDVIDAQIIRLLNERTESVLEIGKLKDEKGTEIYAPDRESAIYSKLESSQSKVLPVNSLKAIYREIMSASLALERPIKIAYLGPEATFTHLASLSRFGSSVQYSPCSSISEVFAEVQKKRADYGVVPIENTTEGAVSHTLDMFFDSDLKICSEIIFEISHFLMSNSKMQNIKRIYSHPQVFGQCRLWLESHLAGVELIDTSTTTHAAKRATGEDGAAAIGSKLAATLYNLNVLAESIEDSPHNQTRFLVIGRSIPKSTGKDKTSLLISIKDKIGALSDLLEPIHKGKFNMTKIESRPSKKKPWEYYFFIDIVGHIDDPAVRKMIEKIETRVKFIRILGSYPSVKNI